MRKMVKALCLLSALCLLMPAALAEFFAEVPQEEIVDQEIVEPEMIELPELTTEQKLEAMLPVLDALSRTELGAGERVYDPDNAAFVWEELIELAGNWYLKREVRAQAQVIAVPETDMLTYARASFPGITALPESAEVGDAHLTYIDGVYQFDAFEPRQIYIVVEGYQESEEALYASVGIYESTYDFRIGGILAALIDNENWTNTILAENENDLRFPLTVSNAQPEPDGGVQGFVSAYIRYEAPEEEGLPEEVLLPFASISWGSSGSDVAALQTRLEALGYSCRGEKGTFGSGTLRAVRYFEDAIGVAQDGVADQEVQNQLYSATAPVYQEYTNLFAGKTGVRVEEMQARLRELGYTGKPVDGNFDERTREAVVLFQAAAGLTADGIAGRMTLTALADEDAPACTAFIDFYRGDTGTRVTEMQDQLRVRGFMSTWANGTYDNATAEALNAFIRSKGFEEDALVMVSARTVASIFGVEITAEPTVTPSPTPDVTPTPTPRAPSRTSGTGRTTPVPTSEETFAPTSEPIYEQTSQPVSDPTSGANIPTDHPGDSGEGGGSSGGGSTGGGSDEGGSSGSSGSDSGGSSGGGGESGSSGGSGEEG